MAFDAASQGAQMAEELWKMGQLPKDDRNAFAKKVARDTLESAGIEVTEQIQMIIDGIIEVVCMLMPHGVKPDGEEGDHGAKEQQDGKDGKNGEDGEEEVDVNADKKEDVGGEVKGNE